MRLKKIILMMAGVFIITCGFSQSDKDTKEFIYENYRQNVPTEIAPSYIWFSFNIRSDEAEGYARRKLSGLDLANIFIFASDIHIGSTILYFSETIDIRDITKVSTTKQSNGNFIISVYLGDNYPSFRRVINSDTGEIKLKEYISPMKIQISNNEQAALKIKKAIVHLGKIRNIQIKDGDLF